MDPQNNQNPMGMPVADPNAGVQTRPVVEPTMTTPPPAGPVVTPVATPEPQAPVEQPAMPAEGTGDTGTGMPPSTPPAV